MEKVNNTEKKSRFHKLMESEFFYHYRRNASAIIGSIIILLAILIAVFGRGLAPQNPYDLTQLDIANGYLPPMWMEGAVLSFPWGQMYRAVAFCLPSFTAAPAHLSSV